jgi:hypothetical protein
MNEDGFLHGVAKNDQMSQLVLQEHECDTELND